MNNSSIEEIFTLGLDTILFIFSLTLMIVLNSQGNEVANKLREEVVNNETVSVAEYEIPTVGYYSNGELKYDGLYEGEEVLFTIVSLEDVTVKIKTESNIINLNTIIYKERLLLDYVKYVDAGYLKRYINIDKQYTKEYIINARGEVTEVIFTEIR